MKTIYLFLADGFEIIEAMTPFDVLTRCGGKVIIISTKEEFTVSSSQGVKIQCDKLLSEVNFDEADALIIPGGYPGYINLRENKLLVEKIKDFLNKGKVIAAICGGPTFFSFNNIAIGKSITAHSSTKNDFKKNYNYTGNVVEVDNNIITAIGAGHSLEFSFAIANKLFNKDEIENAKKGMEL